MYVFELKAGAHVDEEGGYHHAKDPSTNRVRSHQRLDQLLGANKFQFLREIPDEAHEPAKAPELPDDDERAKDPGANIDNDADETSSFDIPEELAGRVNVVNKGGNYFDVYVDGEKMNEKGMRKKAAQSYINDLEIVEDDENEE